MGTEYLGKCYCKKDYSHDKYGEMFKAGNYYDYYLETSGYDDDRHFYWVYYDEFNPDSSCRGCRFHVIKGKMDDHVRVSPFYVTFADMKEVRRMKIEKLENK